MSSRSAFDRMSLRQIKSRAAPFTRGRIPDIRHRSTRVSRRYRGDIAEISQKNVTSALRAAGDIASSRSRCWISPVKRVRARRIDDCFNVALEDRGMLRRGWDESRDQPRV
jgi:hypothetical protein